MKTKAFDYLEKEVLKTAKWKGLSRWVSIYKTLAVIDYLLIENKEDKLTQEILLRLYVEINRVQKKFNSVDMPLKAFNVYLNTVQKIVKKDFVFTV